MGDWLIRQFLASKNFEKHAPLTANLIMCDRTEAPNRLQMLQDHLMTTLEEEQVGTSKASAATSLVSRILPATQVFVQSVRLCAPSLLTHKRIDLAVPTATLLQVLDLAASNESPSHEHETRLLQQFVVLILCPPAPFVNSMADPVSFTRSLLEAESGDEVRARQRQILVGGLAATRSEIAEKVYKERMLLGKLTAGTSAAGTEEEKKGIREHAVAFWRSVGQDRGVRQQLQEERLPVELYKLLRGGEDRKSVV